MAQIRRFPPAVRRNEADGAAKLAGQNLPRPAYATEF
jgi:hypothetical protein